MEPVAGSAPGSTPGSTPGPASAFDVPAELRAAAGAVLAGDGGAYHLRPWQVGYLIATSEGREGRVPPACGAGRGWLQARLDEAMRVG